MKLKHTKFQKVIEIVTIIIILGTLGYLAYSWGNLPNKIPEHYNGIGRIDSWESKNNIFIMPVVSIGLYILITIISLFPSIWNMPMCITDGNGEFAYTNVKSMIILTKMEIIIIFSYITYCDIKSKPLGSWFLPLWLIIIFGTMAYYIAKIYKTGKNSK